MWFFSLIQTAVRLPLRETPIHPIGFCRYLSNEFSLYYLSLPDYSVNYNILFYIINSHQNCNIRHAKSVFFKSRHRPIAFLKYIGFDVWIQWKLILHLKKNAIFNGIDTLFIKGFNFIKRFIRKIFNNIIFIINNLLMK